MRSDERLRDLQCSSTAVKDQTAALFLQNADRQPVNSRKLSSLSLARRKLMTDSLQAQQLSIRKGIAGYFKKFPSHLSNLLNVKDILLLRPIFVPPAASDFRAGISCVQSYRPAPFNTMPERGWSNTASALELDLSRKTISHWDKRLIEIIVSSKHGTQSTWALMPCPGRYSFAIT